MFSKIMRWWRLSCRRRPVLESSQFNSSDLLYREFSLDELDEAGEIDVNTLRLPDLSCNWDRFSHPEDVKYREGGNEMNGCYSIAVEAIWFSDFATPCHDPLCNDRPNNYSHVEVRQLAEGEEKDTSPPRERKKGKSRKAKLRRAEWRTNFVNNIDIEIDAR